MVAPGLPHSFPRPRTELAAPHNLPAPITSFVGRQQERQRLTDLLAEHRMVTVVGAGGSGKTRLAVEVAAGRVDSYPDGVWFVDLAAVTDPGLVVVTLAATLGLRPEPGRPVLDTLAEYVASRRLLLVLDTCDAQIAAVGAAVTALLAAGQGPRVLATSREPIGLPGELVWRIPPMSVREGPDGVPGDAVALLAARAAAARGGNPVAATELPHLTRIAARLDGLPLAIELAAARLRVLGTAQLAARLDAELDRGARDLLDTLDATGSNIRPDEPGAARHATLQAAVNWSYRTLEPQQARLLRALSVFADPVELATAQWLMADDPLAALTVLVEKSLLHTVPAQGGDPRADGQATGSDGYAYRMLDPIRAFAARQLVATGEEHGARERHVAWCLTALRTATVDAAGQPVTLSLYQLDKLAGEIRAALHWCVTRGTARAGLRLVCGLEQWWRERGLAREGRLWLFRLYGRMAETGERVDERVLADAYHVHSLQSGADGEHAEQLRYSHQAEAAARRVGDPGLLARVLATRCWALFDLGELDSAEQACRELIDWAGKQEVAADALFAVYCLALLLRRRGALDEAAELLAAARAAEASRPAVRGRRTADHLLGMVALARGDLVAAHDHLVVALRSRMTYGFHTRACDSLAAMAVRCAAGGDPRTAARLFGAVNAARGRLRVPQGGFGDYWSRQEAQVRSALGDAAFDREYADGGGLTLDQAVQLALSVAQEDRDLPAELGRSAAGTAG